MTDQRHAPPGPILRAAHEGGGEAEPYAGAAARTAPGSEPTPRPGGHAHGRVPSWLLVGVVIAAFIAGGVAVIDQIWWLFWAAVAVVVLSPAAGRLVGIMNDTVEWDVPLASAYQPQGHIILGPTPRPPSRT
ncbi:MAG TPA: hypothetical protein VGL93_27770 [Streptosporangiaceae bacterium]|jgi:hypothetical protein